MSFLKFKDVLGKDIVVNMSNILYITPSETREGVSVLKLINDKEIHIAMNFNTFCREPEENSNLDENVKTSLLMGFEHIIDNLAKSSSEYAEAMEQYNNLLKTLNVKK